MSGTNTILVVDDDIAVHDLIRAMLSDLPWDVEYALSGEEALSKLTSRPYDLVLTDIVMPGIDGLALMNRVREMRPEVKVVVMTVVNTPEHVIGSIRGHAYSYLSKPFTRAALADTLHSALHTAIEADDIKVLSARPGWVALQLRCKLITADRLTVFFREMAADLAPQERDEVSTGFRELLINAIEHGGHADPNQWVKITYVRTSRSIVYHIQDPGEGFSLDNVPHAAISNKSETSFEHVQVRSKLGIRPGGFGILLTKKLVDEVLYNATGNEVLLIKHLT